MRLRSHGSADITITLENLENKRARITLASSATIRDLFQIAYNNRPTECSDASFENFVIAINLTCEDKPLTNLNATLAASKIQNGAIIRESYKTWVTLTANSVDKKTLIGTDPIFSTPIEGVPFILDCDHAFDQSSIKPWMEECLREGKNVNCPCCRAVIRDEQIDALVPVRPAPPPLPLFAITHLTNGRIIVLPNRVLLPALLFALAMEDEIFRDENNEELNPLEENIDPEESDHSTAPTQVIEHDESDDELPPGYLRATPPFRLFSSSSSQDSQDSSEHLSDDDSLSPSPRLSRKRKRDED